MSDEKMRRERLRDFMSMGNMGSIINRAVKSYWTVNNNEKQLKEEYMRYEHLQPEAFYEDKINSCGST